MTALRVAAAQFATSSDIEENLKTCLDMIDAAAATGARLIVLPEFCNHLSVYDSAEHCRRVAVDLDGPFVRSCARRARHHGAHVVLTVTVRRPGGVTVSNLLLDPHGGVVAQADKQTLMGNERAYLRAGPQVAPIVETPFGTIGMYSCMDGVTCEVPRALATGGARLLTNSLNSFALDEAALHVPTRALENQVFVVAANKVGPLLPTDRLDEFSAALAVPPAALDGAGESQIVAPDGSVLAKAPRRGHHVVSATIDLTEVDRVRAAYPAPRRRPALYAPLAEPRTQTPPPDSAETLVAAAVAASGGIAAALAHPRRRRGRGEHPADQPPGGATPVAGGTAPPCTAGEEPSAVRRPGGAPSASADAVRLLVMAEFLEPPANIPEDITVVYTRRDGDRHVGVVADASGVRLEQPQLHNTPRLPWARGTGDGLGTLDLPWGRLAVTVGDDIRLPEVARLAAIQGVNVLAVCHRPATATEVKLLLLERAAENRLCVVAAAPAGAVSGCALIDPPADSLWSPERTKPFDGTINMPTLQRLAPGRDCLVGTVHPRRALRREVSRGTELVAGRSRTAATRLIERP